MKVVSSIKPICKDCYLVRRGKVLYMRCKSSPRHKRRQGFSTMMARPEVEQAHSPSCGCCAEPVVQMSGVQAVKPLQMASLSPLTQFWLRSSVNCLVSGNLVLK